MLVDKRSSPWNSMYSALTDFPRHKNAHQGCMRLETGLVAGHPRYWYLLTAVQSLKLRPSVPLVAAVPLPPPFTHRSQLENSKVRPLQISFDALNLNFKTTAIVQQPQKQTLLTHSRNQNLYWTCGRCIAM